MPFNVLLCEIDEVFEHAIGKSPQNPNQTVFENSL